MIERLFTRNAATEQEQRRDISSCNLSLRSESIDLEARTVDAILATDRVVPVFDWRRFEVIDEVLVADGATVPRQMPLLESHLRHSLDFVLGSVRNPRREGNNWIVTLHFAKDDERAEKAWNKVKQGHVTDVSAGYRATKWQDIPAGQSMEVNGKTYKAGQRMLRISTKWRASEGSLVAIGADEAAKIRDNPGESIEMNKRFRAYLEKNGLRADATEQEAWVFYAKMNSQQRSEADALRDAPDEDGGDGGDGSAGNGGSGAGGNAEGQSGSQRQAPGAPGGGAPAAPAAPASTPSAPAPAPGRSAADAAAAERTRIQEIQRLAGPATPAELLQRALYGDQANNLPPQTVEQAARSFYEHLVGARQAPVGTPANPDRAPSTTRQLNPQDRRRAIGAALVLRSHEVRHVPLTGMGLHDTDEQRKARERIANQSERFRTKSLKDICKLALQIENREVPDDDDEMIRAAISTTALQHIFTDSVNAAMVADFDEAEDTTREWCQEGEVADFKVNKDITRGKNTGGPKRLPRGGTAEHITFSDEGETFRAIRFAEQLAIAEEDIEDDMFNVLTEAPGELMSDMAQIRPDLVYSILFKNPTMTPDGVALFNAAHGNTDTQTLGVTGLKARITEFMKRTRDGRKLNIKPSFILVPPDLAFTADELLDSPAIIIAGTAGSVTERGTKNVLRGKVKVVSDPRLGVAGVVDPMDDAVYAGTATNWFLAGNTRTIKVVYRRGTGKRPRIRPYVLDKGQYGMGWDCCLDIGAFARDFRALDRGNV